MDDNFSPRVKDVITYSKEEALRLGHDFIGTEHLVLGLIRNGEGKAIDILNFLGIDLNELRRKIESLNPINFDNEVKESTKKNLHLTRQAERALKTTFLEAKLFQSSIINTAHLLLCILRNENHPTTKIFNNMEINYNVVNDEYKSIIGKDDFSDEIYKNIKCRVVLHNSNPNYGGINSIEKLEKLLSLNSKIEVQYWEKSGHNIHRDLSLIHI